MNNTNICVTIGANIRDLRMEKKLTVEQLAKELHVSQSAMNERELGRSLFPVEDLRKTANYFGVSLSFLFGHTTIRTIQQESVEVTLWDEFFYSLCGFDEAETRPLLQYLHENCGNAKQKVDVRNRVAAKRTSSLNCQKDSKGILRERIMELKKERGFEFADLREVIAPDKDTNYSEYAAGNMRRKLKSETFNAVELEALADAFKVSVSYLCGETDMRTLHDNSELGKGLCDLHASLDTVHGEKFLEALYIMMIFISRKNSR